MHMPARIPNSFFKNWNEDMAYCLGLWWADGCMHQQRQGGCVVVFSSTDEEHLSRVRGVLGVGSIYTMKGHTRNSYQLTIGRKDMFQDLIALGGTPRKTESSRWPLVPTEHLAHFVRGYVDGDGSLFWHVNRIDFPIPRISVCGTRDFLQGMSIALERANGIPSSMIFRHRNALWQMSWTGIRAKCFAVWLYENSQLHLRRKNMLAREFAEWQPILYHRRFVTPTMHALFQEYLPK
jgi:hypothetical protein